MSVPYNLTNVPKEDAASEPLPLPKQYGEINNLAGDQELADRIWNWVGEKYMWFITQVPRREFCKIGGTMDMADRMYRMALNRDTSSAQDQDTLSNVTSSMFYRQIRTLHSALERVFFMDNDLPAIYEPDNNTDEYTPEEGMRVARQQLMLEAHTFDKDKRIPKLKETMLWALKYGHVFLTHEWDRVIETKVERTPVAWDERGVPTAYDFKEVDKIVKDCPSVKVIGLEHVWFDEQIADMEQQRCILWRSEDGWEVLNKRQRSGQIMNVDKLTSNELFQGYNDIEWVKLQRQKNAGESTAPYPEGRYQIWNAWVRIPVVEKKTKGGKVKAKWDDDAAPQLYWVTFAGQINGGAIPLRIVKNPYFHGKIPCKLLTSHRDDKGAFRMSYAQLIRPLYSQATTNINQCIDNITLRTKKPFVTDGPIHTRDLKFRANKLIKLAKGTTLKEIDIQDTTNITLPMAKYIEEDADKTTGANKAMQAEPIGSRATATAERQSLDQSLAPLDDLADYLADQLFVWLYELDAETWRQYGDPNRVLKITHNNMIEEVRPTELYGPLNVKVTAINRFRNSAMRRMEINSFIQTCYPFAEKIMGPTGKRTFWRDVFKTFGFMDKVNEIFPVAGDYDAQSRSREEVYKMLIAGQWVEPKLEENQEAHLQIEESALREYDLLPEIDRVENNAAMMRRHIEIEKNFLTQKSSQNQSPAAPQPQMGQNQTGGEGQGAGMPAQLSGEQMGEQMGAEGGMNG